MEGFLFWFSSLVKPSRCFQAEAPPAAAQTTPDSDSDSGMGSPAEEAVTMTTADTRDTVLGTETETKGVLVEQVYR